MSLFASLRKSLAQTPLRETRLWAFLRQHYKAVAASSELDRAAKDPRYAKKNRILVINHCFDGEIKALAAALPAFPDTAMFAVAPEPFFTPSVYLFPESISCGREPYDAPQFAELRRKSRELSGKLFRQIRSAYPFDAVLTPSDSFYWLREFLMVCRENKIPVIVADKEGTISPRSFDSEPLRIKKLFPPISDWFLVWSGRQRDFWLKAGVAEERIIVTGAARSDLFVNMKRGAVKNVIFFDFDSDAYINVIDWSKTKWDGPKNWNYLRDAFRAAALAVAKEFPDVEVILKCHPQQASFDFPGALGGVKNLKVMRGAEISGLMPYTYAVAGFQTTALMEAVLAGIPTFYAAWGGLYDVVAPEVLPFHEPGFGMFLCRSGADILTGMRKSIINHGTLQLPDSSGLEMFFNMRDGNCAGRVIQNVLKISGKGK